MTQPTRRTRTTYHHGDLRAALITAGIELARTGGPEAVVLREVTRLVGVAPNSAYGHFKTLAALKAAVAKQALCELGAAMAAHVAAVPEPPGPRAAAVFHLGEVGRAYVRFALEEPGLFRTAMDGNPSGVGTPGSAGHQPAPDAQGQPQPDAILLAALERLTGAGILPPQETGAAVTASWATVHGLATILVNLQPGLSAAERDAAIDNGLRVLLLGVTALG
ncbi:AcrR family transcriptional regulator [Kitasatospora gansuensis]|uniref:AcrR family transcriptional regulator n=1 Tax=Kitasatospora gansuensis TaxID=258050 RepID=A0A7W7WFK0_9ACTN|nr:TetR-like C-terminal domain-containing protein [Kitasatospora gansuensis]MBB4944474.1 AcrR family transcriptional regulator [Kitasatospora gansuensis]MBB4951857.1 AcrR family transcriptional regulator [Kitasatospora gansuensis]MBB4951873.1 AcrR family transcriptional regulator [Kitasatospora gansuensis]